MLGNLPVFFCLIFLASKNSSYLNTSGVILHVLVDFTTGRILHRDLLVL